MLKLLPFTMTQSYFFFKELVNVFFASQDPTTPNQQGPDRGSSYRSIAFIKMQQRRKLLKIKLRSLQPIKCLQPYCYRSEASN
jgi:peptide methionine sulfoxide reductase MsrA